MLITAELAEKVKVVVDAGLTIGVGRPIPGEMCVEAAICYVLREPHGDRPSCVGTAVRAAKLVLNDALWSSDAARAQGMRKLAVAQLGSDTIDQVKFAQTIALKIVQSLIPDLFDELHLEGAQACRDVKNLGDACAAAYAAASAAASAAVYGAAAAAACAAAAAAARAADYAAAAAAYAATATAATRDKFLVKAADIFLSALIDSPGYAFI